MFIFLVSSNNFFYVFELRKKKSSTRRLLCSYFTPKANAHFASDSSIRVGLCFDPIFKASIKLHKTQSVTCTWLSDNRMIYFMA